MVGPATGKARPPTVDSFTDGTLLQQLTLPSPTSTHLKRNAYYFRLLTLPAEYTEQGL